MYNLATINRNIKPYKLNFSTITYFKEKDSLQNELIAIAKQYRKTLSISDKQLLLEKEREIIYQEIKDPNLTIARNNIPLASEKTLFEFAQSLNLRALRVLEYLTGPFETKATQAKINILEELFEKVKNSNSYNAETIKCYIKDVLANLRIIGNKTPSNALKINVIKTSEESSIKNLKNGSLEIYENYETLLDIVKRKSKDTTIENEIKNLVVNILKKENSHKEIKECAIWAAGLHRSDEAYQLIKNISLSTTKNYRQKELALHSLARYLKEKEFDVKDTLKYVCENDELYSPLAKILLAKCNGEYLGVKNRELKNIQNQNIKKLLAYLNLDAKLNVQQTNNLHSTFNILELFIPILKLQGYSACITNDTLTKFKPEKAGIRDSSGLFLDSLNNVSSEKLIILNPKSLNGRSGHYIITHEIIHQLDNLFALSESFKDIYLFYKKNNKCIDHYSTTNVREFIAQAFASLTTHYVATENYPIGNRATVHSVYKLMDKCPELYDICCKYINNLQNTKLNSLS